MVELFLFVFFTWLPSTDENTIFFFIELPHFEKKYFPHCHGLKNILCGGYFCGPYV
jgi:hypothetical protein